MRAFTIVALLVGVALAQEDMTRAARVQSSFEPVEVYQRNSPALNQLFGQAVGQSWKFGQLAAKGVQGELDAKSRNVLREMRKIVTKRALNVRNQYSKLSTPTKRNLQSAVPPVQSAINNYPTFKPIVEIVRKQMPRGFLATLTA